MRDVMAQQTFNQAAAAAVAPTATPVVAPATTHVEGLPGIVVAERPIHKLVEQFLRLNSPQFIRTGDPEAAASWIQKLEKAFALLMCNERKKVVITTYQLEEIANTWWTTTRGAIFPEGVVLEWNTFLEAFNDKYFSKTAREVDMAKFQRLRQGSLTVDQYEAKFAELLLYAP
ncbi:hypothetical protein ACJRO7_027489 [Eucalyptus globulus]|uniref:Retrotransposon gag domain-containing protein n=1 Tax=Eucalyptus globulus TaxID=34317 RepID=A0ABD3JRD8_EUCGL